MILRGGRREKADRFNIGGAIVIRFVVRHHSRHMPDILLVDERVRRVFSAELHRFVWAFFRRNFSKHDSSSADGKNIQNRMDIQDRCIPILG